MIRAVVVAALCIAPYPLWADSVTEVHYVMGTYFRITAEDPDPTRARAAMRECFAAARQDDQRFSRFDPASELSQLNAAAADPQPTVVSADMVALLRRALDLQALTGGAFDISVGVLTQLWRTSAEWPTRSSVDAAQRTDGARAVTLIGSTLMRRPGVLLDFDGIAKGWTVDRCVARLRAAGVERALVNLGESSLYAIGAPGDAGGWAVTLRGLTDDTAVGTLTLRDEAVSVSSVFGHARRIGARRVGHIVDPRSGQALTSPAAAVVVAASATDAEALSKALLITSPGGDRRRRPDWANAPLVGTLLITPTGVRRTGPIPFHAFKTPRRMALAAEALQ